MKYDFTTALERRGHDALAVEALGMPGVPGAPKEGFDAIPMWVADMSFATAPSIVREIVERAQHPAYGYYQTPAAYYKAIVNWQRTRHGVQGLKPEHIGYQNGVLGGLVSALDAFTSPGDYVLVNSPTYIGFTGHIEGAGRRIALSPMKKDASGVWRLDLDDMERVIKKKNITFAVFCSPHNPTGRVWTRDELEAVDALFAKHHCIVFCDEIWSDLILPGREHIPFQSVNDDARMRTIALYAPSKTFNLAGLIGSYSIVYNPYLRARLKKQSARTGYNSQNVLSMHALLGAYTDEGAAWVDQLVDVLAENMRVACDYFGKLEGVSFGVPEGTYMLFLDFTDWCAAHGKTLNELLRAGWDVGVAWQDGRPFHGACHIRMNLALPTARLQEALRRLSAYVFQ